MIKQTAAAISFTLARLWAAIRGEPCPCDFCHAHRDFQAEAIADAARR